MNSTTTPTNTKVPYGMSDEDREDLLRGRALREREQREKEQAAMRERIAAKQKRDEEVARWAAKVDPIAKAVSDNFEALLVQLARLDDPANYGPHVADGEAAPGVVAERTGRRLDWRHVLRAALFREPLDGRRLGVLLNHKGGEWLSDANLRRELRKLLAED